MKHLAILVFVLAMAMCAFAQADSCNMTLLDEWVVPNTYHTSISPAPFCFLDSFIIVANQESTHVLKIDSLEHFEKLATHNFDSRQILAKDSLLFITSRGKFSVYDFNSPYDIDSIGTCTNDGYLFPLIADTVVFYDHSSNLGRVNISDVTNPFNDGYSNALQCSYSYGPFFDGRYLYICGSKEFGEPPYEDYTKAVLEVYDPYAFADSIAFLGRYFWGVDEYEHFKKSSFVEFIQDSFMIFGDSPNIFTLLKVNETRDSFEIITTEADSNFGTNGIRTSGDSLAIITGKEKIHIYDISNLPEYSLVGSYHLDIPYIWSSAINLPYVIIQYQEDYGSIETPITIKLLKYNDTSGIQCGYNSKYKPDFNIYPNPFNSSCSIELALKSKSIEITDIRGNTIEKVSNPSSFNWQPENLPSGLYFVTVDFGDVQLSKKIVYLK